jgi:uncharacterized membrane protein (UPF0127 family)
MSLGASVRSVLAAILLFVAPVACAPEAGRPTSTEKGSFDVAEAILHTDSGPVPLTVEIARTDEEREQGLMFRTHLEEDRGMVFLYSNPTSLGFWMKNTRIPLSIAFFDDKNHILKMLDMKPCHKDPCTVYTPGTEYVGALEVNRGAFRRWGVEVGDLFELKE